MPDITLPAETGRRAGSSASRRLRAEGKVPGVVYGHGMDPLPVAVNSRSLRAALSTEAGLNALLDLQVDGTSHLTLARELQRDPIRNRVTHVDFQIVRLDEVISADVPIALVGEALHVHQGDGIVDQQMFNLAVHATPDRIPNVIEVDISELGIGDTIRVSGQPRAEGVSFDADPDDAVVVGQPPQVEALPEDEAAEAADAAGAAVEGGEPGAEPAGAAG
ncbi:MAG: 50S ribosomal protein L25 [Acidimicrobiales bacterium]